MKWFSKDQLWHSMAIITLPEMYTKLLFTEMDGATLHSVNSHSKFMFTHIEIWGIDYGFVFK